jgi:hypothetical protein
VSMVNSLAYEIGFSPCPNDTFIFDAMVHGRIDTEGLEFEYFLADVEELNKRALLTEVDISKVSYHAFAYMAENYLILDSGSALGHRNGPLLISKREIGSSDLPRARIAIPGKYTTANLLFSIADKNKTEALPIIKGFYALGYRIFATRGTAAMIREQGMDVKAVSRKLNEGHPNIVEIINDGSVVGVVNTITGGRIPLQDGFHIRRAATERRIPCFTSLDTARVVLKVLSQGTQSFNIKPLHEYVKS